MINVLIADDHDIVRLGLKQIVSETADFRLAGEAANGAEALQKARTEICDVLVLDISMPDCSGFEILKALRRERPDLPVLILSVHAEAQIALRFLKAGAAGYLTKESTSAELVGAIRRVSRGGKYISPSLAEALVLNLDSYSDRPRCSTLSDREFQVLCQIGSGKTVSQIAADLSLSVKTISTYRTRVLDKLNLNTTAQAMRYAIQHQLVN